MTLFLPILTSTRSNAFLNVDVSLNDYSSPLHVQNKANSRVTFSTFFFFFIWSLSRHRKTSKPSREIRIKVEFDFSEFGFLMLYVINFGHVLKLLDFGKRYFTAINDWKQKYCETATSTQRENKTMRQIGLLNLRWYQRNYSVFAPFLNSVAVRVYINGVDLFFVCLFVFFRNDFKSGYKLSYWWILFRTELKNEKCSKTLRRKKIVQSCKK